MRRMSAFIVTAMLAVVGLTACAGGDGDGSARQERRSAALVREGPQGAARIQLTLDQVTPPNQAIEALSFAWGVQKPAQQGQANFNEFRITKTLDETSPILFKNLVEGRVIIGGELKLYMDDQSGQRVNYATYQFDRVYIKSINLGGQAEGLPTEEVSFTYQRIREETQMPDAQGQQGPPVRFGWDLALQRPW